MAKRPFVEIKFTCECENYVLEASIWDHDGKSVDDDMVYCSCGRKYVVTRPYIVEVKEVQERADN